MLVEVCRRDHHGVSLDTVCQSANAKLRRRAPYLFGAASAATIEEAETLWQQAKQHERDEAAAAEGDKVSEHEP